MPIRFPEPENVLDPASFFRRLAAIFYDSLLCIALMFVVTGLYMSISHASLGAEEYKLMNDQGQTIKDPLLTALLLTSLFTFFGFFWTKTGQTLGMQVWHIRVQTNEGLSLTWSQALIRFVIAFISAFCFGLGYLWMLFDDEKKTIQCHLSNTRIVRIPKRN